MGCRYVEELVPAALIEHGGKHLQHIVLVPPKRHLVLVRPVLLFLQCFAPDEIMVEFHDMAVAQVVGREVIVLHVVADQRAAQ